VNDLTEIFRAEAEANLKEATRLALACEQAPPGRAEVEAMMRVFHTLKGAARAVRFDQEREIAHRLEDVFHAILDGTAPFRPAVVDLCLLAIDLTRATLEARLAALELPDLATFLTRVDDYQAAPLDAAPLPDPATPQSPEAADGVAGLDLLAIFRLEVQEQLAQARARLADPAVDAEAWDAHLRRVFHTLKGAARAVGCDPVRELAGALEDLVHGEHEAAGSTAVPASPDLIALILCGLRWIETVLERIAGGAEPPPLAGFLEPLARYRDDGILPPCSPPTEQTADQAAPPVPIPSAAVSAASASVGGAAPVVPPEPTVGVTAVPVAGSAAASNGTPPDEPRAEPAPAARRQARLDYEQLDRLHRLSGELTVAVAALAGQRHQLRVLSRTQARAGAQIERLVAAALSEDLDRETLQETLRQGAQRLSAGAGALDVLTAAHDRMEGRLRHLADGLADQVTQARLVPLGDLLDDYPRLARDLALELGKRVDLQLDGIDNRIDRAVLEQLRNPLLHLLRNALDHGIEPVAVRTAQGKPPSGRILVEARQFGSRMRIRVEDDGAGIDQARLAASVIAAGHTTAAFWAHLGVEERMQFLFLPGLSTAATVSATSGRGFGLDIVKAGIEAAGGTVGVRSEPGRGTCFELLVPLSLSLTRCLLVVGGRHPLFGDQRYAFPMGEVARVRRLAAVDLREIAGRLAVHLEEETLPLVQLHAILGLAPVHADLERKHLLVLGEGDSRCALLVEAVVDEQDMVSRPLDERLGKVAEVSGLTLLEDGGLALILDVPDLLQHLHEGVGHLHPAAVREALTAPLPELTPGSGRTEAPADATPAQVLVVEDSVTVREVERHFLEQAGYQVTTAVNGVDGLNKAKAGDHRILITDIDMPRMNGLELIRTLRGIDRFRRLPIIVVSYKDRTEDRDRALEAGADRYVTKSEFDTDAMLALVAQLLAADGAGGGTDPPAPRPAWTPGRAP
jgi:two-component system sensor histidine kinase and response regulator WspE